MHVSAPVTRCSRDGSDASPLGAAVLRFLESSPRSMAVAPPASAAAAAFLLMRLGLRKQPAACVS